MNYFEDRIPPEFLSRAYVKSDHSIMYGYYMAGITLGEKRLSDLTKEQSQKEYADRLKYLNNNGFHFGPNAYAVLCKLRLQI
jgi:hypothetical protein